MTFRLHSRQPPAPASRHQHDPAAGREVVRAEADYERLRAAWLDLATGDDNEVALAMVGADMERANRWLQSLIGPSQPTPAHRRSHVNEQQARHFAEESA